MICRDVVQQAKIDGMKDVRLYRDARATPPSYATSTNIHDFNCAETKLTSLAGSPRLVVGSYWCWHTPITSLLGSPRIVGQDFDCASTFITTLEGAPKYVGGDLNCCLTPLVSLRGAPWSVGGNFEINNTPLESLDFAPRRVGARLCCWHTKIGLGELLVYLTRAKVGEVISDYEFNFEEFKKQSKRGRIKLLFQN
jgi:hypothetical protein